MLSENEKAKIFLKNLSVLHSFHPEITSKLDEQIPFDIEVRYSKKGIPNLYYDFSREKKWVPLYLEENPVRDYPHLIKELINNEGKIICFLGSGLNIFTVPIVKEIGDKNILLFFEAFPGILKESMYYIDLTEIFSNPNVKIVTGNISDPHEILSKESAKLFSSNRYKIIEHKETVSLAPEWYKKSKSIFEAFLNKKIIARRVLEKSGEKIFENRFKNLSQLNDSFPIDTLKDSGKNIPCIIVASGPSLSKNIKNIKKFQKKGVIIAVDSAVGPLLKEDIKPDFIATLDYNSYTFEKLSPFSNEIKNSNLIHVTESCPEIPKYMGFKNMFFSSQNSLLNNLFSRLLNCTITPVNEALSVVHLALFSAQLMGCSPIVFTGLDLAFDGNSDHAEGTVLHWGNSNESTPFEASVESVNGTLIPTTKPFLAMLEVCEKMIKNLPSIKYIDASEGGARINGTYVKTLSETIDSFKEHGENFIWDSEITEKKITQSKLLENLIDLKEELKNLIKKIDDYFVLSEKADDLIKKNRDESKNEINEYVKMMNGINHDLNNNENISFLTELSASKHEKFIDSEVSIMEKISKQKSGNSFHSFAKQQLFIMESRKEDINTFIEIISSQINYFENLLNLEQKIENEPENREYILELAKTCFKNDSIYKTNTLLDKLEDKNPDNFFYKGCCLIKTGEIENGMKLLTKACQSDISFKEKKDLFLSSIEEDYLNCAGVETYQKICLERLLRIDPENKKGLKKVEALKNYRIDKDATGDIERAKQFFNKNNPEKALQILSGLNPFSKKIKAEGLSISAIHHMQTGNFEKGIEELDEAVFYDKNSANIFEEIGDQFFKADNYSNSIKAYERVFAALQKTDVLGKIGESYFLDNNLEEAEKIFSSLIKIDPESRIAKKRLEIISQKR